MTAVDRLSIISHSKTFNTVHIELKCAYYKAERENHKDAKLKDILGLSSFQN